MRALSRRGFTLVEVMVGLVLLGVISGAIYQAISATQRSTSAQVQRMEVHQNARAAALYLSRLLQELDAAEGDIVVADAATLRVRSMQWVGVLCTPTVAAGSDVMFVIRRDLPFGLRVPDAARDSILLYRDGDPQTRTDDRWLAGGLHGSAGSTCLDGSEGTRLRVRINGSSGGNPAALAGVTSGAPLRGFQMEEVSLFEGAEARWWLGQRTASRFGVWTPMQELIGPLTASGLSLTYYDSLGAATALPTDIASVALRVRAESRELMRWRVGIIDYARDSLVTGVALRNNPRF